MLEKEGIGRPSTYASIIGTIVDRGYSTLQGNALTPTLHRLRCDGIAGGALP